MKVIVKIDRKSLRRNPDYGKFFPGNKPVEMAAGPISVSPDGKSASRVVTPIYEMPHWKYLFKYAEDPITCSNCHGVFMPSEIKTKDSEEWDEDTESYFPIEVCPFCEQHLEVDTEYPEVVAKEMGI